MTTPYKIKFPDELKAEMEEEGSELRKYVLMISLRIENITSRVIASFLHLDLSKSELLGNTHRALKFNDKIQFLLETRMLDEKHKTKVLWFSSIRNQLIHNRAAKSMVDCMTFTGGSFKAEHLLKQFPQDESWEIEKRLVFACNDLCNYILDVSLELLRSSVARLEHETKLYDQANKLGEIQEEQERKEAWEALEQMRTIDPEKAAEIEERWGKHVPRP